MSIDRALVDAALAAVTDPNTGLPYAAAKNIKNVAVEGDTVSLQVVLGYPAKRQFEAIRTQFADALRAVPGVANARVEVSQQIAAHTVQRGVKLLPNVKNIVAVASGKGGVGKSTTAVNLALALASEGASVGMLDADIYGPSLPMMLGITGRPESPDEKSMNPMTGHGMQANSIGFLIEQDNPMVWRGPMATSALEQLLRQTNWQRSRLPDRRHAAGHRRHPADAVAARAGDRRGDRHDAAGHRAARREEGPQDVREGRHSDPRHRREHGHAYLLELRPRRAYLRRRRRRADGQGIRRRRARQPAARHRASASRPTRANPPSWRTRTGVSRRSTGRSRARWRSISPSGLAT